MLDNVGQFIQILVSMVTLILAIFRGIPEVHKLLNEWRGKKRAKSKDIGAPFSSDTAGKYLDLAIVLMCSAYFSLVIIDALIISGRNPEPFFSLIATLVISIFITLILTLLWYRKKAELGLGWGAAITLILLIFAPGGVFFSQGEKGGIAGVNLWLPVPILTLLAITMWIYEYGHPLDRAIPKSQRAKGVIALIFIVLLSTVSLGKQFQFSIKNDKLGRTPGDPSINAKILLDAMNKWPRAQKSIFYAAASDNYLIGNYFSSYQSIENRSATAEGDRKKLITTYLATLNTRLSGQDQQIMSDRDYETISDGIINILNNGGGDQDVSYYLTSYINSLSTSVNELSNSDYQVIENYSNDIYSSQIGNTLRKIDVNQALDTFNNLPIEHQKFFLANRLKWVHATGGKNSGLTTTALPGITPEARFNSISLQMIDHALPLQSSRLGTLCIEFDYPPPISQKFCDKDNQVIIDPFNSRNEIEVSTVSIFPELEPSYSKKPLLEQLSLPTDYEAYLALKEYSVLSRSIILGKEEQSSKRNFIEQALNQFDTLDSQTKTAFIYYFINFHSGEGDTEITSDDIYNTILILKREGINPLDNNGKELDESDIHTLSSMIIQGTDPNQLPDNLLTSFAQKILRIKNQDDQEAIRDLLRIQNPDIPIRYLLNTNVFKLVNYLNGNLTNGQRKNFLDAISNPISIVIPSLLETKVLFNEKDFPTNITPTEKAQYVDEVNNAFIKFTQLDNKQQNILLHRLAISLYDAKGIYSHNIFGLIVTQANSWSDNAGLLVASLLYLPIVLLIVMLASFISKQLSGRDRLFQLLSDESSQPDNWQFTVGAPDIVRGREKIIKRLRNLASRGWGSIAIVGRRGVGKTRILLEMLQESTNNNLPKAISAWISTPSRFEESELIESVLERLTSNVENAISKHLGAKPLEIRRLEMNITAIGTIIYILFWIILGSTFYSMSDRVSSDQITSTWFPLFIVSIISGVVLCVHLLNIQPTDLSSWLERDRSSSPHTVLLYRDAKRVLRFLDNRKKASAKDLSEDTFFLSFFRWAGILVSAAVFLFASISAIDSRSGRTITIPATLISLFIFSGLISSLYSSKRRFFQGFSLLSLIAEYRGFVDRAVFRIKHGALGARHVDDFEIVVCIDELDKIIVPSELLAYLRRMKVIFEIPGAYYFLSISEDALHALYLGAAEGKNEIDSTFDHIIRIPPADCNLGEEIARAYLNKHSDKNRNPRIDRTIATISYGVPRDIIRRCDEILANENIQNIEASSVSDTFRKTQANLAYSERLLTREQLREFSGNSDDALNAISSYINKSHLDNDKSTSIILSLWVLSLISSITTIKENGRWQEYSEAARDIGYRILDEQPAVLIEELNQLQKKVTNDKQSE